MVSTVATFASLWLSPRLSAFQARHPDIELAISTTRRTIDLDQEDFDCAIRHGVRQLGWLALPCFSARPLCQLPHSVRSTLLRPLQSLLLVRDIGIGQYRGNDQVAEESRLNKRYSSKAALSLGGSACWCGGRYDGRRVCESPCVPEALAPSRSRDRFGRVLLSGAAA